MHLIVNSVPNGTTPFGVEAYYRIDGNNVSKSELGDSRADDRADVIAGPNGAVHVLIGLPNPSGEILYFRSTNSGVSFSKRPNVESSEAGGRLGQPSGAVDASGVLHVVYGVASDSSAGNKPSVRYAQVENGTVVAKSRVTPEGALGGWHLNLGIGRIAVLGNGVRVVAYQVGDDAAKVYVRTSTDGLSWSTATEVAPSCGGAEGRETVALTTAGTTAWLACPTAGSVKVYRGEWQAPACASGPQLSAVSLSPVAAEGDEQRFEAVYAHCGGAAAFRVVQLRIADQVATGVAAIEVAYEAGRLFFGNDSCSPKEAKALTSQLGALDCELSEVSASGQTLTLRAALSFDASFAGTHGVFFDAKGGSGTPEPRLGWTQMGTYKVTAAPGAVDAGFEPPDSGTPPDAGGPIALTPRDGGPRTLGQCGCRAALVPTWLGALFLSALLGCRRRRNLTMR